jgi:hypothetical protein
VRQVRAQGAQRSQPRAGRAARAMSPEVKETWPGSTPTGKVRTFIVTISKVVEIALDESVITQGILPDGPIFGSRITGNKAQDEMLAVEHLAFNLVGNNLRLSEIDGYANCPDESVSFPYEPWEVEDVRETTPRAPKPPGRKRNR